MLLWIGGGRYFELSMCTKHRSPDKECIIESYFSYSSTKIYVVSTPKNHLIEIFFEHQKHKFKLMSKKIIITTLR